MTSLTPIDLQCIEEIVRKVVREELRILKPCYNSFQEGEYFYKVMNRAREIFLVCECCWLRNKSDFEDCECEKLHVSKICKYCWHSYNNTFSYCNCEDKYAFASEETKKKVALTCGYDDFISRNKK